MLLSCSWRITHRHQGTLPLLFDLRPAKSIVIPEDNNTANAAITSEWVVNVKSGSLKRFDRCVIGTRLFVDHAAVG